MTEPIRTRSNAPSLSIPSTSTPHPTSQELSPTDAPPSQLQDQPKSVPPTADVVAAVQTTREDSKLESQSQELAPIKLDIEHLKVDDDPRLWSNTRKSSVLAIVAFTAMGGTITASIFFPALDDLQRDLNASTNTLALTVSLFILGQGFFPQIWTAISEVSGRKYCYLSALVIYLVTTAVAARATSIGVFIGMRIGQALGSSAVLALGAGSLADIYDTHERGTKLGIFYSVPLVGPALGPILGGALTSASDWRSTFYFLLGYGALCFVLMWLMPNTFRKERSYAWRKAMERSRQHTRENRAKAKAALPQFDEAEIDGGKERDVRTRFQEGERGSAVVGGTFETIKRIRSGTIKSADVDVKLHLRDINPFAATLSIIVVPSNLLVLIYSGLLFAAQYTISYTAARTFAAAPYDYSALIVGCVLLSFGFGNVVGSVVGGRWSDAMLKRMKEKNGGHGEPETSRLLLFSFLRIS